MDVLRGRVAIVTGASRGIGEEIAKRLAAEGARVAVSARTVTPDQSPFDGTITETVEKITANGGEAVAIAADLSNPEDRQRLVAEAEGSLGPVDILVNNAAVTFFVPVADFAEKRYDLMFEVQVKAAFHLAQLVLPGMKERKRGSILNISSGAARHPQGPPYPARGVGGGTVYGMCKAALERFTSGLAAEVFNDGISVNCLSPAGVVATPGVMHHRLIPPGFEDRAEPVELMADAALALVSGDAATLTGKITYSKTLLEELNANA